MKNVFVMVPKLKSMIRLEQYMGNALPVIGLDQMHQTLNTFAMSAKKSVLRKDPLEKPQDSRTNGSVMNFAIRL